MIPHEAVAEAAGAIDDDAYALIGWEGVARILEAAAPHMLAKVHALMDDPEHYDFIGPSTGYVSVDNLRTALKITR